MFSSWVLQFADTFRAKELFIDGVFQSLQTGGPMPWFVGPKNCFGENSQGDDLRPSAPYISLDLIGPDWELHCITCYPVFDGVDWIKDEGRRSISCHAWDLLCRWGQRNWGVRSPITRLASWWVSVRLYCIVSYWPCKLLLCVKILDEGWDWPGVADGSPHVASWWEVRACCCWSWRNWNLTGTFQGFAFYIVRYLTQEPSLIFWHMVIHSKISQNTYILTNQWFCFCFLLAFSWGNL